MADTKLSENPKIVECASDNVVIIKKVLEFLRLTGCVQYVKIRLQ